MAVLKFPTSLLNERVIAVSNVPVTSCVGMERGCAVGCVVEARFVAKERFRADGNVPVAACVAIERICTVGRVMDAINSQSKRPGANGGFFVAGSGVIPKECAADAGAAFATNSSRFRRKRQP